MFLDQVKISVISGNGGNGCTAFRREKFVPRGGPAGGDGGRGGDIILRVNPHMDSLNSFRHKKLYKSDRGQHGQGSNCYGRSGEDTTVPVPPGTVVYDEEKRLLCDLTQPDQCFVVAKGGRGGQGNSHFATATNRAPRYSQPGQPGEEKIIFLELKVIADVGLVGMPNAGKSTLLSRLSHARPKIADYPFTTLHPQVGVVELSGYDSFIMADLPGLIEGASQGKGLGYQFLQHIERTRILLFLIDILDPDPPRTFKMLRHELEAFHPALLERPFLVVLNKIDTSPGKKIAAAKFSRGIKVIYISGVAGTGLPALLNAVRPLLAKK
jgi:GTP-binding protein